MVSSHELVNSELSSWVRAFISYLPGLNLFHRKRIFKTSSSFAILTFRFSFLSPSSDMSAQGRCYFKIRLLRFSTTVQRHTERIWRHVWLYVFNKQYNVFNRPLKAVEEARRVWSRPRGILWAPVFQAGYHPRKRAFNRGGGGPVFEVGCHPRKKKKKKKITLLGLFFRTKAMYAPYIV